MNDLVEIIAEDARRILQKINFSELRQKKILITGASGIIGVNLLACLKELVITKGYDFSVVAVMQSEPFPYLQEICNYPKCLIVRGDITDIQFCRTLPEANYIIHAAGYGQPGRFMQNPVKTLQLNTSSTLLLFEKLLLREPGYVGSYYHLGKLAERAGDYELAILTYKAGMIEAKNANDNHSYNELQGALEEITD